MAFATREGVNLYWESVGSGEPLLLIMGLGGTHEWWHAITPVVSRHFRTILFDNRGAGRSDVPPGPYSIAGMAADAAAVLDAAGVASAHVFGASMGGIIAQEFALAYPARVRSLILGCTAVGGRDAAPARKEVAQALGARATMTREEATRTMLPFIVDPSTPKDRVEADLRVRLSTSVTNEGYFAQLDAIRAWPGTLSRLGAIAVPTLVIHGENDQLVPPENGRIVARAIPSAKLVMLPHASHLFITDQPEAASHAVLSFLGVGAGA